MNTSDIELRETLRIKIDEGTAAVRITIEMPYQVACEWVTAPLSIPHPALASLLAQYMRELMPHG